jgi:hypothetical protein
MRVPDEILNCVCFLATKARVPGRRGLEDFFLGTGFFIQVESAHTTHYYLITARHLIDRARENGYPDLFIRLNRRDGDARTIPISSDWIFPDNPASDVAVLPFDVTREFLLEFWFRPIPFAMLLTKEKADKHWVGAGDDVVIPGLFKYRWGHGRNMPVLRSGIISSMPHPNEPFTQESEDEKDVHLYHAYLIETRSIGGVSGSPVFLVIEPFRVPIAKIPDPKKLQWDYCLIGLIREHWDLDRQDAAQDLPVPSRKKGKTQKAKPDEFRYLNTGIAQVTPITEIESLINGDSLMKERQEADKVAVRPRGKRTLDSEVPSRPRKQKSGEITRAGFQDALRRTSRKVEPKSKESDKTE